MEPKQAKRSGMGFIGTLTLILIVLKAFGLIDVSWLWVFSPRLDCGLVPPSGFRRDPGGGAAEKGKMVKRKRQASGLSQSAEKERMVWQIAQRGVVC